MLPIQRQTALILLVPMILGLSSNASLVMAATDIGNDITSNGDLTVDGALKFANGALNNYLLKTDATGNATWTSVGTALVNATTDDLPEGGTNQYFTNAAADARITLQKGMSNGLATLDAGGQIPAGQIPAMAINDTYVVADIAGRDALIVHTGDVAIVTDAGIPADGIDESRSFIWDGGAWIELLTPLNLYLSKANNLSDVANAGTARTSLGLGAGNSPTMTGLTLSGLANGSILFSGVGG